MMPRIPIPICHYNKDGRLHREDGPAIEYSNGLKYWVKNGKLHRVDGPAIEYADDYKEYWINGESYSALEEGLMDLALE